ncbi:hypothetical protein NOX27_24740 [Enterobacter kobei]|uniref:hypothetical protein n=1 Tax=Enterobacter kobei TaxID=208224 RepID=UPI0021094F85|nr:hypothetical protein [Enterobacter kobei]MCQ4359512.1 hypothetical protein [Enterobacter kobei]HDC4630221.1 hypothetical protein [Enterobacter kobei]HDC4671403.1 hypothetical protein [Enterobacter kobei]
MTTVKYTAFKDAAALDKAIEATVKKAHSLRNEIQNVAVGIILHAYHHGDYTRAESFTHQLGEGVRGKALVDWFIQFGGLIVGEHEDGKSGFVGWKGADFIKENIDKAKATMWWTCKPEPAFEGFDLQDALEKLIAKAEKAMNKANELRHEGKDEDANKVVVPQNVLDGLRKLKAA